MFCVISRIVQWLEHQNHNLRVKGSNPFSIISGESSLMVKYLVCDIKEYGFESPVSPV